MNTDSPKTEPAVGTVMLRYNAGKLPVALVPTSFTRVFNNQKLDWKLWRETAKVLDFGAQKYSAHNWRKGGQWTSVYNSLMRHVLLGLKQGEIKDPESGLDHWGHIGCNLAFLLEFAVMNVGEDDRFKTPNRPLEPGPTLSHPFASIENFIDVMSLWLEGSGNEEYLRMAICVAAEVYAQPTPLAPATALKVAA